MNKSLFGFIWQYSKRQQIIILLITVCSFPILYLSLELPKRIINDAIGSTAFPKSLLGFPLEQVPYLLALCFGFLAMVIINNGIKYTLNIYKGLTGERMLRRLRYELYERVLRFRLPHFRRVSSGEIIPMITAEVQPLGGFIADAIALPAFQGGTLLVYLTFIFMQDPLLGAAAIALYPVQGYIIPRLQKKVNALGKARVKNLRDLSDKVGETIAGIGEIHANDTNAYHIAQINDRLQKNFEIRFEIFRRKFAIKFLNNFMNQLTPFFFYSIGGYLVIQGDISFGALVAVLAAYKDLAGPWKELLGYYQQLADTKVKYDSVVEQFDPEDIYPIERLTENAALDVENATELDLSNVTYGGEGAGQSVDEINLKLPIGKSIGLFGGEGSGRRQLMQLLSGLLSPTSGRVQLANVSVDTMPQSFLGQHFGYVDADPHIFTGTVRENILYGLRHRPVSEFDGSDKDAAYRKSEVEMTGGRAFDLRADWYDLDAAGVGSMEELGTRAIDIADAVGLGDDIFSMGLQARLDAEADPKFADNLLKARQALAHEMAGSLDVSDYVDFWDAKKYNHSATLAENLLFGLPVTGVAGISTVANHPTVRQILKDHDLEATLIEMGLQVAEIMVELFSDLSGDNDLLSTYSFIAPDDIPEFEEILSRKKAGKLGSVKGDRARLIGLSFMLIPTRHRLGLIDKDLENTIVALRPAVQEKLTEAAGEEFFFFDPDAISGALSIEDNLLFGKPRFDRANARDFIEKAIAAIIEEHALRPSIMFAGLGFNVGVAGSRLSSGQKTRLAIARTLMRRPKILVVDDVITGSGTAAERRLLTAARELLPDATFIVGLSSPAMLPDFDYAVALEQGTVVAKGEPESVVPVVLKEAA
ncbi:MAG: ABC transporter transmembrane domain-containing protein [Pseudomonadota bacterium]